VLVVDLAYVLCQFPTVCVFLFGSIAVYWRRSGARGRVGGAKCDLAYGWRRMWRSKQAIAACKTRCQPFSTRWVPTLCQFPDVHLNSIRTRSSPARILHMPFQS
jgi:hypothetical protein